MKRAVVWIVAVALTMTSLAFWCGCEGASSGARKTTAKTSSQEDPQYDATTSATPSAEHSHEQAPGKEE